MSTVRVATPAQLVGSGGQGSVHELAEGGPMLIKRYLPAVSVDADGLDALIGWRAALTEPDRRALDATTCWPRERVTTPAGEIAIVFPRAPRRFTFGDGSLAEIQFAFSEAGRWAGVEPPSVLRVVAAVFDYAVAFDVLHRNRAVFLDVSHTNLLYAPRGRAGGFLLDNDSVVLAETPPALPAVETLLWNDRRTGGDGSFAAMQDAAVFKLGLVFVRSFYRSTLQVHSCTRRLQLPAQPPLTPRMAEVLTSSLRGTGGARPTPADWIDALGRLHRVLRRSGHR